MAETEALDIVGLSPSRLNTLASQAAQTMISPHPKSAVRKIAKPAFN
jgi:hypothetical protein